MKKIILATAAIAALSAGAAQAQDTNYSGFYVGIHGGAAFPKDAGDETVVFDRNLDGTYSDAPDAFPNFSPGFNSGQARGVTPADGANGDDNQPTFGGRIGYDMQYGAWVFGIVGEYEANSTRDTVSAYSTTPASYVFSRKLNGVAALRARVGYVSGDFLPYITAGVAHADVDYSFNTSNSTNTFTGSNTDNPDGYQVGAGVETKLTSNITMGLEYLYTAFDDEEYTVRVAGGAVGGPFTSVNAGGTDLRRSEDKFDYHAVRATMAYRF